MLLWVLQIIVLCLLCEIFTQQFFSHNSSFLDLWLNESYFCCNTHLKKKWDCLFHSFEVFCIHNLGYFLKLLINNQLSSSLCACVWQGPDYEIRTYQPTKWVSTSVSGMQLEAALSTGFRRLFNYIQGNNKNSEFHVTAITFTQGKLSLCCWGCASFIFWRCGKSVTKPTRHNGSILMLHNKFTENWGSKASMDGKVGESALSFLLSTLQQFLLSYFCLAQQFAAIFMRIYIVCVAGSWGQQHKEIVICKHGV